MKDNETKKSIILGLSFYYHDAAAALIIDGVPVAMSEEERFSLKKHDSDYPQHAIKFVLDTAKVNPSDIDYVVFYEKPFVKFERMFKTYLATWPLAPLVFASSIKSMLLDKLWVRSRIAEDLKIDPKKILFSDHHLSHAASAYYASPYDKSAILTIDGIGEWATATISKGEGSNIQILKEIHFPHSLGLLYSAFTAFLGFEVNEGEYKVMGMAPYGTPKYVDKVKKLITVFADGSFKLDMSYFTFHRSTNRSYSKKFETLFGTPRDPKSYFFTRATGWLSYFGEKPADFEKLGEAQEYYADIAASLQAVTEEIIIGLARAAHKETGLDKLCYAGGVALNCVANRKIIEHTGFDEVYIQPAAGDAGAAFGAAMYVEHALLGHSRHYTMAEAYYGKSFSEDEVRAFLDGAGIKYKYFSNDDELCDYVANGLANSKVAGWFSGRFEWGPRALGSRSIIADPRNDDMKNIVNVKIKFREPYRPFAPSVLAERLSEFFDIDHTEKHYPLRFMLYVTKVREDKKSIVPAITHVDGTARPQAVFEKESPRYYKLIKAFEKITGVPLVMNTSFNLKGEPIVTSPADAYSTFIRSGLDMLVLERFVVEKE